MINPITLINYSIGVGGLTLAVIGLLLCFLIRPVEFRMRSYLIAILTTLIAYTGSIVVSYLAELYSNAGGMRWGIYLSSFFSSLLMPLLTLYMLFLSHEDFRKSGLFWSVAALWVLYFGLLTATLFTPAFYTVDDAGVYRRGPLYPLLLAPLVVIMLLNLWGLWRRREKIPKNSRTALLIYIVAPLVSMVIQMVYYGILATAVGSIVGTLAIFINMITYQVDGYIAQAKENTRKDFEIRVLQMHPHFVYNALVSIYYLVESDPEKAQSAIKSYASYLNQNFRSITKREPIPFEEELAHTRAYLAIEQVRFEDKLNVTFDTPHTDFVLPPLTLQPIVENAVKHGMDPERGFLNVVIRTRAVEDGSEIIVENDGADFDAADEGSDRIGLSSTRERIRGMCGGTLSIEPRDGGGTVVRLWIPKGK